ncbi:hypothetical protein OnM2_025121 [Erysiphe neolycopersici]|uniref:Uncharacterized protein n=1 Tax=Erysiphe neolycopersici TaxID=212602 RepID=A0A420I1A7_9PEZI|nr:hypothetical protein OnM2_025121 [Erysiphe neolycopersici]
MILSLAHKTRVWQCCFRDLRRSRPFDRLSLASHYTSLRMQKVEARAFIPLLLLRLAHNAKTR